MQQLWKEWEQSPHTTTHSPEAEGDVEEEPDDGREVKGRVPAVAAMLDEVDEGVEEGGGGEGVSLMIK
eukprot:PDM64642.1 hypothetical protein PRIPAC_52898 [Pristionchus pacificus]